MTAGQKKLLEFCKEHILRNELTEAIEIIDAILKALPIETITKVEWQTAQQELEKILNKT